MGQSGRGRTLFGKMSALVFFLDKDDQAIRSGAVLGGVCGATGVSTQLHKRELMSEQCSAQCHVPSSFKLMPHPHSSFASRSRGNKDMATGDGAFNIHSAWYNTLQHLASPQCQKSDALKCERSL
jgi:hypothetical protein